ncbi:hypothetical protein ACFZA2_03255 [Microbacterium sp. NPDC007973]|uniref:hypothetical protein n=1 Tax=Microbacterium sp. NPDC007973 TaxID=3364182 RepID=UPI0036E7D9C1
MTLDLAAHGAALVCSGVASCCARSGPADGRRERIVASMLMTAAMLDAAALHLAAPIVWAAALLAAAMVSSVTRRWRAGRGGHGVYVPAGLVVMAALIASSMHGDPFSTAAATHAHSGPALTGICAALAVGYTAASAYRMRRGSPTDRAHHAAMGGSTALMALGALL